MLLLVGWFVEGTGHALFTTVDIVLFEQLTPRRALMTRAVVKLGFTTFHLGIL
jgi:hypothetical protein